MSCPSIRSALLVHRLLLLDLAKAFDSPQVLRGHIPVAIGWRSLPQLLKTVFSRTEITFVVVVCSESVLRFINLRTAGVRLLQTLEYCPCVIWSLLPEQRSHHGDQEPAVTKSRFQFRLRALECCHSVQRHRRGCQGAIVRPVKARHAAAATC